MRRAKTSSNSIWLAILAKEPVYIPDPVYNSWCRRMTIIILFLFSTALVLSLVLMSYILSEGNNAYRHPRGADIVNAVEKDQTNNIEFAPSSNEVSDEPQSSLNSSVEVDCDPNYGPCIKNVTYDLDCKDISSMVTVVGYDRHGFDRDGDGYGCESN